MGGSTDQTRNLYNEDGEAPQHCAAVRGEQPAASLFLCLSVWGFSYIYAKLQLVFCFVFWMVLQSPMIFVTNIWTSFMFLAHEDDQFVISAVSQANNTFARSIMELVLYKFP